VASVPCPTAPTFFCGVSELQSRSDTRPSKPTCGRPTQLLPNKIHLKRNETRSESAKHLVYSQQPCLQDIGQAISTEDLTVRNRLNDLEMVPLQESPCRPKRIPATMRVIHNPDILIFEPSERHLQSVLPEEKIRQNDNNSAARFQCLPAVTQQPLRVEDVFNNVGGQDDIVALRLDGSW